MAKARTEARGLGSCRPSVLRFMSAFAPLRWHPGKSTQSAPVPISGANGGYGTLGCLGAGSCSAVYPSVSAADRGCLLHLGETQLQSALVAARPWIPASHVCQWYLTIRINKQVYECMYEWLNG